MCATCGAPGHVRAVELTGAEPVAPLEDHELIELVCERDELQEQIAQRSAAGGYLSALKTILALEPVVRAQLQQAGPGPRSVGPLEQFFRELSATVGPRAGRLTNKTRADALLTLLAADRNGWTDETAWAELIRSHLLDQQGLPRQQRQHTDPGHTPTLRRLPQPLPIDV